MKAGFEVATLVVGARGAGQDRAAVIDAGAELWIALADGAGGTGGGDVAADAVVASLATIGNDLLAHVAALDDPRVLGGGQATAVVLRVGAGAIVGASVGDSVAWLVGADGIVELTGEQRRKPLLGSGEARVTPFEHGAWSGTLLVASDGLASYVRRADVVATLAAAGDLAVAAQRLVELVRLASGGLPDDVSIVLVR